MFLDEPTANLDPAATRAIEAVVTALHERGVKIVMTTHDLGQARRHAVEIAAREGARIVVLVFDNERYGTIRMWQARRGTGEGVATELGSVDFAAIARGLGARGVRVERDDDVEPAIRQALAEERSTVIQLTLDRAWVSVDQPATG